MTQRCALLLAVVVGATLAADNAHAEYSYRFATEVPGTAAGPVNGSFLVSDSAIADGFITADEIQSFSYSMQQATAPFARATFAPPDPLTLSGRITVDPATGELIGNGYDITIVNGATGQTLDVGCFGHLEPGEGGYTVTAAHGTQNVGVGTCSVAHAITTAGPTAAVPASGVASLLSLAALLVLIACWHLRRR